MQRLLKAHWQRWLARRIPAARQVKLDQRRIFIVPTRLGAAFFALLALLLLLAINYQNNMAYVLTFLLASLFLVTILHTYANLAGLQISAGATRAVFAGEQAGFTVGLRAERRGHQAIACGWPPGPLPINDVAPEQVVEQELTCASQQRGWLRPGRLRVESRFPLGLLVAWSWVDLDQRVLVYPKALAAPLPQALGASEDQEQGARAQGSGGEDFQGLRRYQPADGPRRIAWKAYARGQGLMVKDFAALTGRDQVLDFNAVEGDCETRLSILCHWALQLTEQEQPYCLVLPHQRIGPDVGPAHRDACLKALALFGLPA